MWFDSVHRHCTIAFASHILLLCHTFRQLLLAFTNLLLIVETFLFYRTSYLSRHYLQKLTGKVNIDWHFKLNSVNVLSGRTWLLLLLLLLFSPLPSLLYVATVDLTMPKPKNGLQPSVFVCFLRQPLKKRERAKVVRPKKIICCLCHFCAKATWRFRGRTVRSKLRIFVRDR